MTTSAELPVYNHERDSRPSDPVYRVTSSGDIVSDHATFDEALAVYRRTPHAQLFNHELVREWGYLDGLTKEQREELGR